MAIQPVTSYAPEEYLALERNAPYKSEYYAGEIFSIAGASRWHNIIVANVLGELHPQLKGTPCTAYASDLRLKITPTGLYTYPDVAVVCGTSHFEDAQLDTLLNPTLLIEVLSPSTADYDRGSKFAHYRKLTSWQEYVCIAQDRPYVEHYVRQSAMQWLLTEIDGIEASFTLPTIHCDLALRDVYDHVECAEQAQPAP